MHDRRPGAPEFVPLDVFLSRPHEPVYDAPPYEEESVAALEFDAVPDLQPISPDFSDACAEVRRFRASLADALDAKLDALLRDLACDVLARELELAPADLAAIVTSALERCTADTPVAVRVHPEEAPVLARLDLPVVCDASLRRGDAVIDVAFGTIDASLGARLEAVLGR